MKLNETDIERLHGRINAALEHAEGGQCDGAHHKAWTIDQMVRALLGCPIVKVTREYKGKEYYEYVQGQSVEYNKFIREFENADHETGEVLFAWELGIP